MIHRYFIILAYKGTPFCGWQTQPNGVSVQETLERTLNLLLQENIRLTGAGRTDTGVHALFYAAHFDSEKENLHADKTLIYKINQLVPKEIAIYRIVPVAPDANARFDAILRTYHYRIAIRKNPFTADLAHHFYRPLDLKKMNEAAAILLTYEDFTSFSKLHGNAKTNICHVSEAYWTKDDRNGEICFTIKANRFLRNMVRAIVGTLLEVGLGKIQPEKVHCIMEAKDRGAAGTSVPSQGLYLSNIQYPYSIE